VTLYIDIGAPPPDNEEAQKGQAQSISRAQAEALVDGMTAPEPKGSSAESIVDGLSDEAKGVSAGLGADFDPTTYASKSLRWSLSRGDTLEEKRLRLKKHHPEGELNVRPKSLMSGLEEDVVVWRENPNTQWKRIEPDGLSMDDLVGDTLEAIGPSAESIVGETAMAIRTRGVSVLATIGRQVFGALAGETFEQAGQYVNDVQDQSLMEVGGEIVTEGGYSAVGGYIMSPIAATQNIIRGAGALRVGDEGIEVIRAANEIDKKGLGEKLTPGLVTDNPAMRLQEKQASALLPGFQRRYNAMLKRLDAAVRSSAPGNVSDAMTEVVTSLNTFKNYFLGKIKNSPKVLTDGGKALQAGIKDFGEKSKLIVDDLYDVARGIQEPEFDLKNFFTVANDLKAGAKGKFDKKLNAVISEISSIKGPKELPSGKVLSVTDQIRNARTQLGDLKHVNIGEAPTQATGQASDLHKALTEAINNPKNADPAFLAAWGKANSAARLRHTTLGQAKVILASKSEEPYKLAKSLIRAGESDNLKALRFTVSPKHWDEFVDAAYGEILRDPKNAKAYFDSLDQETLDVLLPKRDQALLKTVVDEVDRIARIGVDDIAETQVTNKNFIDTLLSDANPRAAMTAMRAANQTNNKAMRSSFRAAIVEWAWDGVVEKTARGVQANHGRLKGRIAKLKRSGMWRMLSPDERKIIGNAEVVTRAFQRVADAGTSIQAAEAAKGITRLQANAISTFVQYGLVSHFYLSPLGRQMLIGSGAPNANSAMLRALGGSLAQISRPEDISQLAAQDKRRK